VIALLVLDVLFSHRWNERYRRASDLWR